jgi:hypothetical protein
VAPQTTREARVVPGLTRMTKKIFANMFTFHQIPQRTIQIIAVRSLEGDKFARRPFDEIKACRPSHPQ